MPSIALPVSLRGQLLNSVRAAPAAFSPSTLFALAEPGVWYDPSDLTTLFQDPAGTIPVTTPGQTVALALDKSKGLVLGSELVTNGDFSNGTTGWSTTGDWVIQNGRAEKLTNTANSNLAFTAPAVAGVSYLFELDVVSQSGSNFVFINTTGTIVTISGSGRLRALVVSPVSGSAITFAVRSNTASTLIVDNISVKELPGFHATQATLASRPTYGVVPLGGRRNLLTNTTTMSTQSVVVTAVAHTLSFTGTGTVVLTGASIAGPLIGTGAGNRVSLTFTPTAGSLTMTVVGSVTLAQLETGSSATNYQRVGSAFDVTEAGVQSLSYLSFDGVDDFLITPTITPGINKAQVFAGVRKLSDAAVGMIAELSVDAANNAGAFFFTSGQSPISTSRYSVLARGNAAASVGQTGVVSTGDAPDTAVISSTNDIAGDLSTIRRNGVAGTSGTADKGAGNFLAYPLYIGRRAGASIPFNGQLYSLLVRFGTNLDAGTITSTETWVNGKTGAYT